MDYRGTPAGSLLIAASRKGLAFLSFKKRSKKNFIERKRLKERILCLKAGFLKWPEKNLSSRRLIERAKTLSLNVKREWPIRPKEIQPALKIITRAIDQLSDYFNGHRRTFHIKKDLSNLTCFEKKVLKELEKIPCGQTSSYKEIARRIGQPGASRAVGRAVSNNPFPIIIPCHRIIRSDGTLGGFAGGPSIKRILLAHEERGKDRKLKRRTVMTNQQNRLFAFIFLLSLAVIGGAMMACAQEHPEHPQEQSEEHPAEHPIAEKPEITKEALAKAIEDYINKEASQTEGYYLFHDPQENKDLYLTLDRVHKDRLSRISEDVYFACADFKSKDGLLYDLDFFMKGTSPEDMEFKEVYLHKKQGQERYSWVEEGGFWKRQTLESSQPQ